MEQQNMKFVDVQKLDGKALDWAVGKAQELENCINITRASKTLLLDHMIYSPSTDWAQGGPLLEKHCIELTIGEDDYFARRTATSRYESCPVWSGHTMLIAACRAIVGNKLGYLIEVPSELINQQ